MRSRVQERLAEHLLDLSTAQMLTLTSQPLLGVTSPPAWQCSFRSASWPAPVARSLVCLSQLSSSSAALPPYWPLPAVVAGRPTAAHGVVAVPGVSAHLPQPETLYTLASPAEPPPELCGGSRLAPEKIKRHSEPNLIPTNNVSKTTVHVNIEEDNNENNDQY